MENRIAWDKVDYIWNTLHSGNYGGQNLTFLFYQLQSWISGINEVSMRPSGSRWNFDNFFNGWGARAKTSLSPLLKLKKLFANFAVFMSAMNVRPLAHHGDTWLVSMIMSLLVPVNTDKMRHSPAHLVEKNAQNVDFRRPPIRRLKKIIGLGTINNWNFFW